MGRERSNSKGKGGRRRGKGITQKESLERMAAVERAIVRGWAPSRIARHYAEQWDLTERGAWHWVQKTLRSMADGGELKRRERTAQRKAQLEGLHARALEKAGALDPDDPDARLERKVEDERAAQGWGRIALQAQKYLIEIDGVADVASGKAKVDVDVNTAVTVVQFTARQRRERIAELERRRAAQHQAASGQASDEGTDAEAQE